MMQYDRPLKENTMVKTDLRSLISKLNATCRGALEAAAGLCLSHTHYEVEPEHFFIKLLEMQNTDLHKIIRHFEINEGRLVADLTRAIEGFKRGNARTPALSPRIPLMIQNSWLMASVDYQAQAVRSGHIVLVSSLRCGDEPDAHCQFRHFQEDIR